MFVQRLLGAEGKRSAVDVSRRDERANDGSGGDNDEDEDEDLDGNSMARLVAGGGHARQSDLCDKSAAEFSKLREGLLRSTR